MSGLDLLGVEPVRVIQIRVKNAGELAAKQGGVAGAVAAQLVPETIESVVLNKMVQQFGASLKEKGVDAEVVVVPLGSPVPPPSQRGPFLKGMVASAGLGGAGYAAWRFWLRRYF